jgi:hypothetical protein
LRKISEAKSLFFKKINKIEKSLGRCVKEEKRFKLLKSEVEMGTQLPIL